MKLALLALWATVSMVEGYKILCVFPVPTASHHILGKGIVDALLQAGHQVWWATPYPEKEKQPANNLTIIDVSATRVVFKDLKMSEVSMFATFHMGTDIAAIAARAQGMRQAMLEQFDAVVTEWFMTDLPAGYAAAQKVPWIMLSSVVSHPYLEHLVDEVTSAPLIPTFVTPAPIPMGFWQRIANSVVVGGMKIGMWALRLYSSNVYVDVFDPLASARGTTLPPLTDVYNNVSVLLMNSHPILAPAQSFPPNVVDIAGYHIQETSLTEDLQRLLDSSPQGFIYFSLGSVVKMSELSPAVKVELRRLLSELPHTVLWRSDEPLPGLPDHVLVREWFPQSGILAHPNCKLFITHAGLLSIIEAAHHGVPLLAVPVFGDQPSNAERAVAAGFAVKVDFQAMAVEMKGALGEILSNYSYYKTAKHLSKLFRSRPVAPSKLISHYVELAIESRGAYHLRSQARHYAWYQRARIDQLLVCAALGCALYAAAAALRKRGKTKKE